MDKVSNDGVITIEESKDNEDRAGLVEGMQFDRDIFLHIWHRYGKDGSSLDDPYILITDKKISNIQDILPCWSRSYSQEQNFLSSQKISKEKLLQL